MRYVDGFVVPVPKRKLAAWGGFKVLVANPAILGELLSGPDAKKAKRVMEAMLKMKKIDIAALNAAAKEVS